MRWRLTERIARCHAGCHPCIVSCLQAFISASLHTRALQGILPKLQQRPASTNAEAQAYSRWELGVLPKGLHRACCSTTEWCSAFATSGMLHQSHQICWQRSVAMPSCNTAVHHGQRPTISRTLISRCLKQLKPGRLRQTDGSEHAVEDTRCSPAKSPIGNALLPSCEAGRCVLVSSITNSSLCSNFQMLRRGYFQLSDLSQDGS